MVASEIAETLIKENPIMLFSKSYCPYSKKAKAKFAELKRPYTAVELDERGDGSEIQRYLFGKTGQNTVPFVYINQKLIGGCSDLLELDRKGDLEKILPKN